MFVFVMTFYWASANVPLVKCRYRRFSKLSLLNYSMDDIVAKRGCLINERKPKEEISTSVAEK